MQRERSPTLSTYDGPEVRYDSVLVMVSFVPFIGFMNVLASGLFLADQRGQRETTKVPAIARGSVRVGIVSHLVYTTAVVAYLSGVL